MAGPVDECKHEISRETCGECMPRPSARIVLHGDVGPWFEARYSGGLCSGCEERIHQGDRIRADGEGGYLCVGCGNLV